MLMCGTDSEHNDGMISVFDAAFLEYYPPVVSLQEVGEHALLRDLNVLAPWRRNSMGVDHPAIFSHFATT